MGHIAITEKQQQQQQSVVVEKESPVQSSIIRDNFLLVEATLTSIPLDVDDAFGSDCLTVCPSVCLHFVRRARDSANQRRSKGNRKTEARFMFSHTNLYVGLTAATFVITSLLSSLS